MQKPIINLVTVALEEDIGHHDLTTYATVPEDARCHVRLTANQKGVLSGVRPFKLAFKIMRAEIQNWEAKSDGQAVKKGEIIASFTANTRAALGAERTGMNFIQHLSGIATTTAKYIDAIKDYPNCRICDTRKTTPLLRDLEKIAVKHGGGANHRHSLESGILIKENHITAAGGIAPAVALARKYAPHLLNIEVETESLEEVQQALDAGADVIMLDNMDNETMRKAVEMAHAQNVLLEASGNATLERLPGMAATGVDIISVGAITHSAHILDMSLRIENAQ